MLTVNPSEVIWTILCFLALYFVLKRFLFDPLVAFMERTVKIIASARTVKRMARTILLSLMVPLVMLILLILM